MDLFKADPKRIAALILNDSLELAEVPMRRRTIVAACIEKLKQEAAAKLEVFEHDVTLSNTKVEITRKLNALGVGYPKSATKADLFALLP